MQLVFSLSDRFRATFRQRGAAFVLALIVELLIALMLLGLIPSITPEKPVKMSTFGIATNEGDKPAAKEEPKAKAKAKAAKSTAEPLPPKSEIEPPPPVPEAKQPPSFLVVTRQDYASGDITRFKSSAPATASEDSGDTDRRASSGAGDSPVVGKGPRGEPLYAADWYRKPTRTELMTYVPARDAGVVGWGLIICRTIDRYRVEDCQELADAPHGSGYAGAARQAAWQFRIKPPRVGGEYQLGTWVKIKIIWTEHGFDVE